jgi:outer membrane protein OmpA-like peptidoglycan-associated protein
MKQLIAAGMLLFSSAVLVWGQTAAEIEGILDTKEITYTQAAYFTLASAPGTPPTSQAGAFALARGWLPKNAEAEGKVRLDGLSLLLMRSFDMPGGGLMYRLFHNARYAYRELKSLGFIEGRVYPGFTVSGEWFLHILGNVLSYAGDAEALEAAVLPVPPPVPPPVQEEREHIAEIIHTELVEKNITDTEVRATTQGITVSLNNIQFLPDSTELTEEEKRKLQDIAAILNEFPTRKIFVAGHAAMAGSAEGRMRVSIDRAQAVADYLVGLGRRTRDEITVRGYGAEQPLGDPATEAGQALNRRVEITLLDEGSGNE